ncbi:MAG: hypothetical protein K0R20_1033 [Actinomycetia bacterium]|nr:hypothetical protein [Actinomycetes bacterium]
MIGAVVFLTRDDAPTRGAGDGATASDGDVASPTPPPFGFDDTSRKLVKTSPEPMGARHRRASVAAATEAQEVLTDLYTEGFLDPANWEQGSYVDAFGGFARGARDQAESHPGPLTAGAGAGDRYERIEPKTGRIATRVLLDRQGAPVLLVSVVRFTAVATGSDEVVLRSVGQYFFERVGRAWKIVSFDVTRNDGPRRAA